MERVLRIRDAAESGGLEMRPKAAVPGRGTRYDRAIPDTLCQDGCHKVEMQHTGRKAKAKMGKKSSDVFGEGRRTTLHYGVPEIVSDASSSYDARQLEDYKGDVRAGSTFVTSSFAIAAGDTANIVEYSQANIGRWCLAERCNNPKKTEAAPSPMIDAKQLALKLDAILESHRGHREVRRRYGQGGHYGRRGGNNRRREC